jgi:cell division protein FtsL
MEIAYKNKYKNQGQIRYDYDRNAVRKPLPDIEPPLKQPVRGPAAVPDISTQPKPRAARRRKVNILYIGLIIIGTLVLGEIISIYSELTELSVASYKLEKEISSMEKEKSLLEYEVNKKMPMREIEGYAQNVLGMVKISDSDITYLRNTSAESFEIAKGAGNAGGIAGYLLGKLKGFALTVWNFIN